MTDQEKAIEYVSNFLGDKTKRVLLVRGYDNKAKVKVVLSCLNEVFDKGIIRTSSMSDISSFINEAFNFKFLPSAVKSTTTYKIGKMAVRLNSYASNTKSNPTGNEGTFTLFYPLQTVLDNSKRYADFLDDIKNAKSSKVILITTNEWGIKNWDIENQVDEVYFYNVENDNPQLISNLKNNKAI
ncbi:hypothetical protein MOC41_06650 [Bacillus spizizenii]|nr:hypothetical protein [Bacillus spizizenii]MCY7989924.1 hypothetical protein [Bacillus spizizenii]MCY7996770.1 hypothetical protein [Bacillus spizizenii]MCY8051269.1 hypothetical protein [Bacillus spizizenii]MCY8300289.1 hypothetical protein [Bacillus spizizenii]